uniref:Uncharacterized protein n=1 Tax=Prolemur simus TaxID=1328070 RepID=A0A8C8YFR2_PROSS
EVPPAPSLVLTALSWRLCCPPQPVLLLTAQETNTARGTGVTWTRWPRCAGSRTTLPTLEGTQALLMWQLMGPLRDQPAQPRAPLLTRPGFATDPTHCPASHCGELTSKLSLAPRKLKAQL